MAQNSAIIKDADGEYSDWIEIYNPTLNPVDLAGWWLTDDKTELKKWEFPQVTLPAQGYLLVFNMMPQNCPPGFIITNSQ